MRFTNRFGKRQIIYGKTINEIRKKLRTEQYEDEKKLNVIDSNMTLDEWFDVWMDTCKKNCRDSTRQNYRVSYNRIKASLGWRKLSGLNLIVMQQAFNELKTDASRKDSKRILIDMFNKAINADLLNKNIAKQINMVVTKDGKPQEPRVLTLEETDWFLEAAFHYRNFNEFSLALETGMRIGEILGLKWPGIEGKGRKAPEGYEDLLFVTAKNTPISPRDTTVVMKLVRREISCLPSERQAVFCLHNPRNMIY